MQLLIAANSVTQANADVQPTSGTPQYATDGNPSTSTPATVFPAYHYNLVMAELCNAIEDAGIGLSGTTFNQLSEAILLRAGDYCADSGALNALSITLQPVPPSLNSLIGVPIRVYVGTTNTGAATLNVNGLGAVAIHQGGFALSGGELLRGAMYVMVYDGSVFECVATGAGTINAANGTAGNQVVNIAQFPFVKTSSGYFKLPNGLMVQWGTISVTGPASSPTNYSFPTAFPTACLAVFVCFQGSIPPTSGNVGANTVNQYQFAATNTASSTNGANFFAIGY